jgi:hypothetical protein
MILNKTITFKLSNAICVDFFNLKKIEPLNHAFTLYYTIIVLNTPAKKL